MNEQALQQGTTALLSTQRVAAVLDVCPATVTRLVRRGDLEAIRVGGQLRFAASELASYLERQTIR